MSPRTRIWLNNIPYVVMLGLGAVLLAMTFPTGVWRWLAPVLYVVYGLLGTLWVTLFICPYCAAHGSAGCPSGHGLIAAKLRSRRTGDFSAQFRKHIPVIVPLWFIPLVAGAVRLLGGFSWVLLVLSIAFAADALVLVPMLSRGHGCATCPQRSNCPWMRQRK
jgi:hypothetical protein